ncbi:MAG: sigma 54-interacting transcriptional regulator [Opitutales bacterium]|nr:sigma 54-interacting transcriptional regulator [Opitutales bacterium]
MIGNSCRLYDELSLLLEISQTLERSLDLSDVMAPVLEKMAGLFGMRRGIVSILNGKTNALLPQYTYGLSKDEQNTKSFERILHYTQTAVDTGKPLIVPDIRKDAELAPRASEYPELIDGKQVSFISAPIRMEDKVVGCISIERLAPVSRGFDADLRLLLLMGSVIARAIELRRQAQERYELLEEENKKLQEHIENRYKPDNMVGSSNVMRMVYGHIEQVADSNTTVLLRGESGTGKELAAFAIHIASRRRNKTFLKFNCAALPESIIESELFGHEKGAFTGALAMRKGRFEIADGGTIFLDEIGDITPSTQVKLLRVLQEKCIERVGSHETIHCDVRVIAATSRNLEEMISTGKFREDLYYRLNVFPIYMPALRDRKTDILLLADHFVEKFSRDMGKKVRRISSVAIDMLVQYYWPGNVRELENCIERAVLLCNGSAIEAHHLPPTLQVKDESDKPRGTLQSAVDALEQELIFDALKQTKGNISKASRELGLTERIMGLRIKKYAIDTRRFK